VADVGSRLRPGKSPKFTGEKSPSAEAYLENIRTKRDYYLLMSSIPHRYPPRKPSRGSSTATDVFSLRGVVAILILAGAAVIPSRQGVAQTLAPAEFVIGDDAYLKRIWSTDDGLPSNTVTALAQTPDGYLWISALGGLLRFDGSDLVRIDIGGADAGRATFWHLAVDTTGALWGILSYGRTGDYELVRRVAGAWEGDGAAVVLLRDGRTSRYEIPEALGGAYLSGSILVTRSGDCWVAASSSAVFRIRDAETTRFQLDTSTTWVRQIAEDAEGRIWLATGAGLFGWNGDSFAPHRTVRSGGVYGLIATKDGRLWAANVDRTLERVDLSATDSGARSGRATAATAVVPFDYSSMHVTLEDAEGGLWFGTNTAGLVHVRRKMLAAPKTDTETPLNSLLVLAVEPRTADSVWLVYRCGLWVGRADGTLLPFSEEDAVEGARPVSFSEPGCVRDVAKAADGSLWILHGGDGLAHLSGRGREEFLDPHSGSPRPPGPDNPEFLGNLLLTTDSEGSLWYVREGEALVNVSPTGEQAVYPLPDAGLEFTVNALVSGVGGDLWLAADGGFGRLSDGDFELWHSSEWASGAAVHDIHVDAEGLAWVGTGGAGLLLVDGESVYRMTHRDGLVDDFILGIVETDGGDLWLMSRSGLVIVARMELRDFLRGIDGPPDFGVLGPADGVPMFRNLRTAGVKGSDGRIWLFGRGSIVVDPAAVRWNDAAPVIVLERILAGGVALRLSAETKPGGGYQPVVVPAGTEGVEIRYTVATFEHPERVRFRYRLEGQEDAWVEAGGQRQASYTNLWPGEYTFRVAARKNFGPWSEETVGVVVLPLWWQTTWFLTLAVLGLIGVGVVGQAARGRALRRRHVVLESEIVARRAAEVELKKLSRRMITAQEEDRARVARDLHDDISQRLYATSMGMDPALRSISTAPEKAAAEFRVLQTDLDAIAEDTRKISHELHPAILEMFGLAVGLDDLCEKLAAADSVATHIATTEHVEEQTSPEINLCLYRIAQETLHNVAKHAEASEVCVELTSHPGAVRLRICDDGRGFDPDSTEIGLGLASMRERARLMGGSLVVDTKPGAGTELVVEIPADDRES